MTPPLVQLASYGPGWAMLAVFAGVLILLSGGIVGMLRWILGKQYETFYQDHKDTREFTKNAIEALRDIREACNHCHVDVVNTVKLEVGAGTDKVIDAVWSSNERMVATTREGTKEIVTALGREEDRTVDAIRSGLQAIQRDNDLSQRVQTPPPVPSTGSQVRESAAPLPTVSRRR
jgi:hypothetical protein